MKLSNDIVLITGGASGIGLAAAERCLADGATVVITDLASSKGALEAQRLAEHYANRVVFKALDVSSSVAVNEVFADVIATFGKIDAVFNNAGIGGVCPAHEYSDEDFNHVVDINLTGVFRVARAALQHMYPQGSGVIVNCASILGKVGQSGTAAYSAAKGAVVNLTRTLAIEAAPHGVRVVGIGPAYIKTPLLDTLDDATMNALVALHPMQRLGKPEEVASAFAFLVSQDASFITGTTLMVDGGFTAGKS